MSIYYTILVNMPLPLKFFPVKNTIINPKGYKKGIQLPSLKPHPLDRGHLINWATWF